MCAQSCPTLCDPMDCSPQDSLPMEFSREEYQSGLPFPTLGSNRYRAIQIIFFFLSKFGEFESFEEFVRVI